VKKIVVFVLGPDRTGIIAAVSKILFDQGCNLEDVSQTILQRQFVGIFIASMADDRNEDEVLSALRARILSRSVRAPEAGGEGRRRQAGRRAFVMPVGADRPGSWQG
jgi:glycine cleavage system transcriptional repressor